jgi:hypothetical protein
LLKELYEVDGVKELVPAFEIDPTTTASRRFGATVSLSETEPQLGDRPPASSQIFKPRRKDVPFIFTYQVDGDGSGGILSQEFYSEEWSRLVSFILCCHTSHFIFSLAHQEIERRGPLKD